MGALGGWPPWLLALRGTLGSTQQQRPAWWLPPRLCSDDEDGYGGDAPSGYDAPYGQGTPGERAGLTLQLKAVRCLQFFCSLPPRDEGRVLLRPPAPARGRAAWPVPIFFLGFFPGFVPHPLKFMDICRFNGFP